MRMSFGSDVRPRCLARMVLTILLLVSVFGAAQPRAQALDPIVYTLRFPQPSNHSVEVQADVPASGLGQGDLMMAVWTPGSYLVREFERNVENVSARTRSGRSTTVLKTQKNQWRIATGGEASIVVSYRVYCREMSVRTNWVE